MRFSHKTSLCFSGALFIMLLCCGYFLSQHKLIWLDEAFTQHLSIDKPSYADILTLHFVDGNKCPIFYINQKIVSNIFSFHYPNFLCEGPHDISDVRSQIIMRIPSNIYMSLALACIFYFFTRFFSVFIAIYALAVALVSPIVWMYWVEARPYSLWFLLTTAQLLFFCTTILFPKIKVTRSIYWTHILLVFTTPGSIIQITIVTLMLFLRGGYKRKQLIWAWLLPVCIFLFYYFLVPVYKFNAVNLYNALFEVVMPERMFIYVVYMLAAWGLSEKRKKSSSNTFFLPIFLLFLLSGCCEIFMNVPNHNIRFFAFHYRYLIYLAPADILMFSLASFDLWKWSVKNFWVCLNVSIVFAGLMIIRGLLTYREILVNALYLHSPA